MVPTTPTPIPDGDTVPVPPRPRATWSPASSTGLVALAVLCAASIGAGLAVEFDGSADLVHRLRVLALVAAAAAMVAGLIARRAAR